MIGQSISHYRILGKLGEGGMGIVYRVRDLHLDRDAAVKVLPADKVADPDRRRRFVLEAKAASALSHPNIVTIYDIDSDAGTYFIAMEYVAGQTLAASIEPAGMPIAKALDCAVDISSALASAHAAGIIHRDLKPANVILAESGAAKVLDFGLAKLVEEPSGVQETASTADATHAGTIVGTAGYMSPEQASGQRVDVRTDIFSFGSLLYEALTGRRAFTGDSTASTLAAVLRDSPAPAEKLRAEVPADLARIVHRCLEKDREARYPSAVELHKELSACRDRFERRQSGVHAILRQPRFVIPALLVLLALITAGSWFVVRSGRARWVRDVALPEAARLIEAEEFGKAFQVVRQAERYAPNDTRLQELKKQCAVTIAVNTTPPGADVYWKDYPAIDSPWEFLGQTPLKDAWVSRQYLRWKITKEGYEPQERARLGLPSTPLAITLYRAPLAPGMIRIPAGAIGLPGTGGVKLGEFWLDRYEVTNRQFKEFMDRGGYQDRKFWKQEFSDGGKQVSWEEAMTRFRDITGRPGPATWELGTYPEGQEDYPVSGVSWYEAAAYAEFAGKSLPTLYHWRYASGQGRFDLVPLSNFGGKGPARVGSYQGIAPLGCYDMAGNVKEWCWNEAGSGLRYVLGGSWNEPAYMFADPDAQPPFSRTTTMGFRCIKYLDPVPAQLASAYRYFTRDYSKEKPVSDEIFKVYKNLFAYDRTELKPKVEQVDDSPRYWRREKVTFNAAYGAERVIAVLFLPKNATPPYQTVVYFPGSQAFLNKGHSDSIKGSGNDYIMRSGRALMYPIYRGSYERGSGAIGGPEELSDVQWRESGIAMSKDFGRSLDYLETRTDIDAAKLAYYGGSMGAEFGPVLLAVEGRIRTAVLEAGGLAPYHVAPEMDPMNFAPRVHVPVLMLSGRYDFTFPLAGYQIPLFRLLGVPEADKRHVLFETGHGVSRTPAIKEILQWLDNYLGPVRTKG